MKGNKTKEKSKLEKKERRIKMRQNEIRKLLVLRADTIDELIAKINKRVEQEGIKILNYDIREERGSVAAVVFYAEFD